MEYTKGEWKAEKHITNNAAKPPDRYHWNIKAPTGEPYHAILVADLVRTEDSNLISAAPTMYETLKAIKVAWTLGNISNVPIPILDMIDKAIAKAEGK